MHERIHHGRNEFGRRLTSGHPDHEEQTSCLIQTAAVSLNILNPRNPPVLIDVNELGQGSAQKQKPCRAGCLSGDQPSYREQRDSQSTEERC